MYQKTYSFPHFVDRETRTVKLSSGLKSINECLGVLLRTRPRRIIRRPRLGM